MERKAKEKLVGELQNIFATSELVVLLRQSNVTVAEATDFRSRGRASSVHYKVTKNSLARRALQGSDYEHLQPHFVGPTAIAYGDDEVTAAKIVVDYMKEVDKFEIVAGAHRSRALDASAIKHLASLPSLHELRGQLVGLLQAPASRLTTVVQAPAAGLARLLGAYARKV